MTSSHSRRLSRILLGAFVAFPFHLPMEIVQDPTVEAQTERRPLPSAEELASLPPDGGEHWNRLVFEKSPYLLQHAANPVDWFPWGEEALARAKELDRPIFLSVGYATCHWCHVMEHESFEDDEVAALLNEHFVCVKVDREERPDLDHVYMSVTQVITGRGGWPMTVVMTPEGIPFFAGTYIPKTGRFGRRGMMDLLPAIDEVWRTRRTEVERDAARITKLVQSSVTGEPGGDLGARELDQAVRGLVATHDAAHGGFGSAPKFPMPHNLLFLLQQSRRRGDDDARRVVENSLRAMRRGGLYDHVGFGFHRYSTDERWLVPHFEKMLYDQALMAMAYTAAWQVTGEDEFRRTAEEVLEYVQRDMTSPEGGFYSAEDADSEGEEGLFYLWTADELREVLGADEAALFARAFGVEAEGNFRDEATQRRSGRNILHLARPLAELAADLEVEEGALRARLDEARGKLFRMREKRIHPLKDDKVLTDWNGLMIAAFARAGQAFDDERYVEAAARAAGFVLAELAPGGGRLLKRWRDGEAGLPGTLEDHAFLTWGLLELWEATFDVRWLRAAIEITDAMIEHFHDDVRGAFFLTADDGEELFVRGKEIFDGAIPSGNSVAALDLLRLARITGEVRYEELAAETMRAFSGEVTRSPGVFTMLMTAVDFAEGPSYEVVIAGDAQAEDTQAMLRAIRSRFLPHKVVVRRSAEGDGAPVTEIAEYAKPQTSLDGRATAYVCRQFTCEAPTTDVEVVLRSLEARD